MNEQMLLLATFGILASGPFFYCAGHLVGRRKGRDEQWISDYLAYERKTQAGRDNLGRFKKRKAPYGKIKITAQQNQL
jgi:hypothetical protein